MEDKEMSIYLSRILSGYYVFTFNNHYYKLKYPSMSIKYAADIFANEEKEKNKYNDWIRSEDIEYFLIDMGIWTSEGNKILDSLFKQIEDYKVDLYNNWLNPPRLKQIRQKLKTARKNYENLLMRKHSFDYITLEGYSNALKNEFLLIHSIYYHDTEERVFKDFDNTNSRMFNDLSTVIQNNTISMNTFRLLARSSQWRNIWSASKNDIFGKPTIEWTDEQNTLVLISKMYDSAYEHPECPADSVIEDDDMFDGWLTIQKRENDKNREKRRTEKMIENKGKNLSKAQEVFFVANSKEEADAIHGLNNVQNKNIIAERTKFVIGSNRPIEEKELPDVQRNISMQINQQMRKK